MTLASHTPLDRAIAAALITGYQRWISPHKGFACAHRVLHRGASCSQYAKQMVMQHGLIAAIPHVRSRFQDCRVAHQILLEQRALRALQAESDPEKSGRKADPANPNNACTDNACAVLDGAGNCGDVADCSTDCLLFEPGDWGCGSLDCSSLDCGSLDCGSLDCGSCG